MPNLDDLLAHVSEADGTVQPVAGGRGGRDAQHPRLLLARQVLRAALSRDQVRLLRSKSALCVVIVVPSAGWKEPIADAAKSLCSWHRVHTPSAKKRGMTQDIDAAATAEKIAGGGRVLAVTDDPKGAVPRFMLTTADLIVDVPQPSDEAIRRTIAAVARCRVPSVPNGIAKGLSYEEIVGALRMFSSPEECIDRLSAAGRRGITSDPAVDGAPDLDGLAGYGAAMQWCRRLVSDLEDWRAGRAPFPSGARVVFAGPPGVGKTTLVRSLAKAAKIPLVATSVGSWFSQNEGHLGDVIRAMQGVWDTAKASSPCIVFLDEVDAVPNRATLSDRAREWWTPMITHLLTLLDGANAASDGLVIVGATNFATSLDDALVRPGRLQRVILIEAPQTEAECEAILRHHLNGDLAAEDLSAVAPMVLGLSGAEMMAIVADARRRAKLAGRPLSVRDLATVAQPQDDRPPEALLRSAIHEAGHVVAAHRMGQTVRYASLTRKGDSGGRVSAAPNLKDLPTRATVEQAIIVALSGMAAEETMLGDVSTGAGGFPGSDLATATEAVASLRTSYGLAGTLTFLASADKAIGLLENDELRCHVERDLQRLHAQARQLASRERVAIERIAVSLVETRFLSGSQIERILASSLREPDSQDGPATTPSSGARPKELRHPIGRTLPDILRGARRHDAGS